MLNGDLGPVFANIPDGEVSPFKSRLRDEIQASPHGVETYKKLLIEPYPATADQLRALLHSNRTDPRHPVLVRAGPGSGKTTVLTRRYLLLLLRGISPERILCATFTRRAAGEMLERIRCRLADLAPLESSSPQIDRFRELIADGRHWVATFHANCHSLLRNGFADRGPVIDRLGGQYDESFQLIGRERRVSIIDEIMDTLSDGGHFHTRSVLNQLNDWRLNLISPVEAGNQPETDLDIIAVKVYRQFNERKREEGLLDFYDLIYHIGQLIRSDPDFREAVCQHFQFTLVDEFQDTNPAQQLIVSKLADSDGRLFAVGDPNQAIYGWRGASSEMINNFRQYYPEATVVSVSRNFRSTMFITFLANEIIDGFDGERAELEPAPGEDGELRHGRSPGLFVADTAEEESEFIQYYVEKLVEDDGYNYADIAILVRLNDQKDQLKRVLQSSSVPVVELGTSQFFRNPLTKSYLAGLRCLRDLYDIRHGPERDETTIPDHWCEWSLGPLGPFEGKKPGLYDDIEGVGELCSREADPDVDARSMELFRRCLKHMKGIVDDLHAGLMLSECTDALSNLYFVDNRRLDRRCFRRCLEWTGDNVRREGIGGIDQLLTKATLQRHDPQFSVGDEQNGVILSTIHGVKGMEFPVVLMPGLEESWLPHASPGTGRVSNIDEERRLFFVGVTRAEDELMFSYSRHRTIDDRRVSRSPSRFLDDIPDEYLDIRRKQLNWFQWAVEKLRSLFSNHR